MTSVRVFDWLDFSVSTVGGAADTSTVSFTDATFKWKSRSAVCPTVTTSPSWISVPKPGSSTLTL